MLIRKTGDYSGEESVSVGTGGHGSSEFPGLHRWEMFYVDKTQFISEWMQTGDKVTLITRPRRFGKTLILSTVETFFDPRYVDHPEYFKELKVWKDPACRTRFGSTPVILRALETVKGEIISRQ